MTKTNKAGRRDALRAKLVACFDPAAALVDEDGRVNGFQVADALGVSPATARGYLDVFAEEEGLVACYARSGHGNRRIRTYALVPVERRGTKTERRARMNTESEESKALVAKLADALKARGVNALVEGNWNTGVEVTLDLANLRALVTALAGGAS